MTIFITRPRQDAEPLSAKLRAAGHRVALAPLLDIVPRVGVVMPSEKFQAICVTSANGIRCLAGPVTSDLPVLAVGAQSAAAAKARGFHNVAAHGGDVHGLVAYICKALRPNDGPLLYLSGAETSGDLEGQLQQAGFRVTRLVTYDAVAQPLDAFVLGLQAGDIVLLYSPRSAKLWLKEIARLGLQDVSEKLTHYCLSPQVALALPKHFHTRIANAPNEEAMLALLDLADEGE